MNMLVFDIPRTKAVSGIVESGGTSDEGCSSISHSPGS